MTRSYEISEEKLGNYLAKIQNETGREIVFQRVDVLGISGIPCSYQYHPSRILILVRRDVDFADPRTRQYIAHEATHGLLEHAKGHFRAVLKRDASEDEKRQAEILATIIEDIVVNRILQDEGFPPFSSVYLPMVRKETDSIRKGESLYNLYKQVSNDTLTIDRFIVFRYIMAWGFLKYLSLETHEREIIEEFLETFETKCLKEFEMATQVRTIILQNDILSAEGNNNAMKELVKLWGLEDLVRLETV